jgi:hypothetical protein
LVEEKVPKPPHSHPGEEALENYAMGRSRGAQLAQIEKHLLVCSICQDRLEELEAFLAAMRSAAGAVLDSWNFVHTTKDGPVRLVAARSESGQWTARFEGKDLEGSRDFDSLRAAHDFLVRSFAEMFPEHRCTAKCRHLKPRPKPKRLVRGCGAGGSFEP